MDQSTKDLLKKMYDGDKRSLARLMSFIDNRHPDLLEIMDDVHKKSTNAFRIGVTGPPGAGKSTLVDKLIRDIRAQNKTVGVVAIDPSSPFSGGAVLGDRIRMQDHNGDDGVFIRSLGSRGAHGGLSRATRDIVQLLDASGVDVILIETVGVGQTELDIMSVADTTLVVLVPESGDTIQTMKAGLMEIADIFVVNKSDREGADRIYNELRALSEMYSTEWNVPVLKAVALKSEGIREIIETIHGHQDHMADKQQDPAFKEKLLKTETVDILLSEISELVIDKLQSDKAYKKIYEDLLKEKLNPYGAVQQILKLIQL